MSEIPGQSRHALPDLKPPVCANAGSDGTTASKNAGDGTTASKNAGDGKNPREIFSKPRHRERRAAIEDVGALRRAAGKAKNQAPSVFAP
jgi:hypothetical protein